MLPPVWWLALTLVAAPPAEGRYRVVQDDIHIEKEVWSLYCDTQKTAVSSTKGAILDVGVDGPEWWATGSGRRFGTGTCEGRNKTLAATKRSVSKKGTVTLTCRSQRVTLGTEESTQTVSSTNGRLTMKTRARLHFKDRGDDCISTLTRKTVAVPVAAKKDPAPVVVDVCQVPGDVARIAVQPKVATVKVGGKPVCFDVELFDENKCTATGRVLFVVDPPSEGRIDDKGCFSPSSQIQAEEVVAVVAKVGDVQGAATARILPPTMDAPKKTLKRLAKESKSERAKAVIQEVTRGALSITPLTSAPPELPPLPGYKTERRLALWISLSGALVLLVAAVLLFRRRSRATKLAAEPVKTPERGAGLQCPQCKFQFAAGEATVCPFDGSKLEPYGREVRQTMYVPTSGGMVCPRCQSKFPTKARFCGHDGAPLLPDLGQFDE